MIKSSNKSFTTSVNLKFDIGNKDFIQRYLPTPSHAEFLKGIISGFLGEKKNNAHIMIGPYGSGKSLAATIVADIFSRNISSHDFKQLTSKYKNVDQEIYEKLIEASKFDTQFIPVILSGNEGDFGSSIINSINRAVLNAGYKLELPGEIEEINKILENWGNKFPKTINEFKRSLKEKDLTFHQWKKQLDENNQAEIEWFKEQYSNLSSGAKFQLDYEENFIDKVAKIIDQLKEKHLNIFIVYDEFGRFLQSLEVSKIYKTMQELQDLAEIANRSNNTIQLLLISHRNMSHYFSSHGDELKSEFQRIEKRFKMYFIESDKATFYRIAQEYTKNLQEELLLLNLESQDSKWILKKYNLFSELNHQEIEKLIVEGSYPIHPLALFLIPRLSSIFGQNERTLFTFLESDETGGLNNFILKHKDQIYYPHILFDYFFVNSIDTFIMDESFKVLKIFAKLTNKIKISKDKKGQLDLLKFITLWELSNANNIVKLNDELLIYGTGQSKEELDVNLNELVRQKLLRFNRILAQWELYEGSSVIVDELLELERGSFQINSNNRIGEITHLLKKKFYLATDYNDDKNMTRFAEVNVMTSEQFLVNDFDKYNVDSDGEIYFIIPINPNAYNDVISKMSSIQKKEIILSITDKEFILIRNEIDRLILLENILMNKKILAEHNNLEEELNILIEETRFEILDFISDFEDFKKNVKWYHLGERINISHEVELENKISEIMYDLYPYTPEIRNDSINRRNLNGMQTKAIFNVLNNLIKYPNFENFKIEGQGPDYLIYATIFKNNELIVSNLNEISYKPYELLRKEVLKFIKSEKKGTVDEIEKIFISYPFGIRKPLIPLLFVSLLRDHWDQLMFYRNGMYVTAVDAEKLFGIFEEPSNYQFVYHDYSKNFLSFIARVEAIFKEYVSEYVLDQTAVIRASSGILNWLRQLPRHTQITDNLQVELLEFKDTVRKVEVNPLVSLQIMQQQYKNELKINELKQGLENHFDMFKKEVILKLIESFHVNSLEELNEKYSTYSPEQIKRNRLLKSMELNSTDFIEEFALNYTGVELENWSDTTFDLFERQAKNDYLDTLHAIRDKESITIGYNDKKKSIKKIELSTKSQTIYENVNRMIKNAGRSVPREEIEYIVYKLLEEYID